MSGTVAAALAGAALLVVGPVRGSGRASLLAGTGRLAATSLASVRPPRRWRVPFSSRALPFGLGVAALLVSTALAAPSALLLAIPVAVLAALGRLLARDFVTRRSTTARLRATGTALRILVGELEAGVQPPAALAATAEAVPEMAAVFGAAAAAASAGEDPGGVLGEQPDPQLRAIGAAWRLSAATGAALATVLSRIAADFAAADEQRRAVETALAGPRSSALVLALLPALGVLLGAGMGAHPLQFLVGTLAGRLLCCVGVILDAFGVLWMRALLRRAEQP